MADRLIIKAKHRDADLPSIIQASGRLHGKQILCVVSGLGCVVACVDLKTDEVHLHHDATAWAPPRQPTLAVTIDEALARVAEVRAVGSDPVHPRHLKGAWAGELACDGAGHPTLTLRRKVAAYAEVSLYSEDTGTTAGWGFRVERKARWFAESAMVEHMPARLPSAVAAFQAALGEVFSLVQVACGVRDTHVRQSIDADYGLLKPRRYASDTLAPIRVKVGRGKKARVYELPHLTEQGTPDAPGTMPELREQAKALEAEAGGLLAALNRTWAGIEDDDAHATYMRAYNLLRYTAAALESPHCAGPEADEALALFEQARQAWEGELARLNKQGEAMQAGQPGVRQMVERLALSAGKLARSCKAGQRSLTARMAKHKADIDRTKAAQKKVRAEERAADAAVGRKKKVKPTAQGRRQALTDLATFHMNNGGGSSDHATLLREYAADGWIIGKYADPIEDAREGLSATEAAEIALEDPQLIYLVAPTEKPGKAKPVKAKPVKAPPRVADKAPAAPRQAPPAGQDAAIMAGFQAALAGLAAQLQATG